MDKRSCNDQDALLQEKDALLQDKDAMLLEKERQLEERQREMEAVRASLEERREEEEEAASQADLNKRRQISKPAKVVEEAEHQVKLVVQAVAEQLLSHTLAHKYLTVV